MKKTTQNAACFNSSMGARAQGIGYEQQMAPTLSAVRHDATVVYCKEKKVEVDGNILRSLPAPRMEAQR